MYIQTHTNIHEAVCWLFYRCFFFFAAAIEIVGSAARKYTVTLGAHRFGMAVGLWVCVFVAPSCSCLLPIFNFPKLVFLTIFHYGALTKFLHINFWKYIADISFNSYTYVHISICIHLYVQYVFYEILIYKNSRFPSGCC